MNILKRLVLFAVVLAMATFAVQAGNFDYQLQAQKVAKDTYVFVGKTEDFSFENGGNIVNTGFIVTTAGVIVIDTGPSLRYGKQMKSAIASVTDKSINRVYLTHHHPDHFLGNLAFEGTPIYALSTTAENIKNEGAGFADNLYLMVGDWMRGTDSFQPTKIAKAGRVLLGGHDIEILSYSGHTSGDMAILDNTTGVLFSGDLIFHKRTLTTPHANIDKWLATIDSLNKLPFKVLVPGHGPISRDKTALSGMSSYLRWLDKTLEKAAKKGLSMTETMRLDLPQSFASNSLLKQEFSRSVVHLFPSYESRVFKRVN
ncbi:MAG: MBL fold metallo-hydrolase [Cycloclasticus sp. symbiont of Poecilosclerida sp. N]|nr:MAG: MBL fold metallo-hydrolase [Cycloclasticus sp. symbiont of Poecilosclerida sp. N]